MKINCLFLNSMFTWFMVTLTSLHISLILCNTIHWALKLQKAKQHCLDDENEGSDSDADDSGWEDDEDAGDYF